MIEALSAIASVFTDPYLLSLIFATTILGVIIGVLPGLGATTGAALLLPFTLTMEPVQAIAVLSTIYVSATFAGSITAILINTPGTSAAAATTFDGYPLAQKGEAGRGTESAHGTAEGRERGRGEAAGIGGNISRRQWCDGRWSICPSRWRSSIGGRRNSESGRNRAGGFGRRGTNADAAGIFWRLRKHRWQGRGR